MEINVNHTIRIICEVPFYIIDNFSFYWDINCHFSRVQVDVSHFP